VRAPLCAAFPYPCCEYDQDHVFTDHQAAQWILPCQIDRTQRTVDHSHFDGVSFAAC
jgi:hypothetical protein